MQGSDQPLNLLPRSSQAGYHFPVLMSPYSSQQYPSSSTFTNGQLFRFQKQEPIGTNGTNHGMNTNLMNIEPLRINQAPFSRFQNSMYFDNQFSQNSCQQNIFQG